MPEDLSCELEKQLRTKGTALQAAEKLALFEGYGLQAVHNCCVMNPALAAEGCFPGPTATCSAAPEVRFLFNLNFALKAKLFLSPEPPQ